MSTSNTNNLKKNLKTFNQFMKSLPTLYKILYDYSKENGTKGGIELSIGILRVKNTISNNEYKVLKADFSKQRVAKMKIKQNPEQALEILKQLAK